MRIKPFALFAFSLGLAFLAIWISVAQTSNVSASQSAVVLAASRSSINRVAVAQSTLSISPTDVVLVLDAAEAQAYDAPSAQYFPGGDPTKGCNPADVGLLNVNACIHACNQANDCHPFQEVKTAAQAFIDQMRSNYDRVAVVSYNRAPTEVYALGTDLAQAINNINAMQIPDNGGAPCPYLVSPDDLWKCTSSNIGGGIFVASKELTSSLPISRPAIVVLASGSADATDPAPSSDPDTALWGFCPPRLDSVSPPILISPGVYSKGSPAPLCRSRNFNTWQLPSHTPITTTGMLSITYPPAFDAKDYAVMWGQYIGSSANAAGTGGMGVLMYTIGLGKKVVCVAGTYNSTTGACTQPWDANYVDPDTGLPNGAESLLRYIASVGDDGDPSTDPCMVGGVPTPSGQQCGNYYFASNSAALQGDFLAVASRIFTPTFPIANFSADPLTGVLPLTVTFTNQSTGSYTDSLWDFGDGLTSTLQSPTHTYTTSGIFTGSLTVTGPGQSNTFTRTNYITVYQPLSADFTATPLTGPAPLVVTFTNQSTGGYTDSLWDFGDGLTSTLQNPTHTYATSGIFTVSLTVAGPGQSNTFTRTNYITVYQPLSANFTATPLTGLVPLVVTFTNQSAGGYTDSLWDFGDGLTSTLQNPGHIYTASGVFTASLTVAGLGQSDTLTRTDYITVTAYQIYLPLLLKN